MMVPPLPHRRSHPCPRSPVQRRIHPVHRSPYKYKKAQEHWWLTTHRKDIEYGAPTERKLKFLLHCLR